MKSNMLKLNEDKTELIVFAPKHRLNDFRNCQLQFDGCVVSDAPFVKNLGVDFDKALNMEKHGNITPIVRWFDDKIQLRVISITVIA
jgi:anion-transporting  ArsA/GET3 family ATPase